MRVRKLAFDQKKIMTIQEKKESQLNQEKNKNKTLFKHKERNTILTEKNRKKPRSRPARYRRRKKQVLSSYFFIQLFFLLQ